MYELGKIYVNNNSKQMLKIYKIKKEDNLGCTFIQNSLSIDYSESLYEKYATSNKSFVKFRVYKELALMYESGVECPLDKEIAKKLYAESENSLYEFSMKNVK
jgi:TPR repeat protein